MSPARTGERGPAARASGGAVRLLGVLAVVVGLGVQPATWRPAPAAGGVTVDVTTLSPPVATSGAALQVAGTVGNSGRQPVREAVVRLRVSRTPLGSRSELSAVLAGKVASRDGEVVVETRLADLAPGATAPFDLRQPLSDLPMLTDFGVYALAVEVVGRRGSGEPGRAAIVRTVLPWSPTNHDYAPSGMSWVWPLVGRPVRLAGGVFADDSLAADLAEGGRLDRLLQAGERLQRAAAVTWALDPDLVDTVAAMADGYRVATRSGGTVAGGGSGLAQRWLSQLQSATAGAAVIALPYADVDATALVRHGTAGEVGRARSAGAGTLARLLPAVTTLDEVAWPVNGYADRPTLAAYARSGVTAAVLDGRALPPTIDLSYTPSGRARVATGSGEVAGLLADPGLTDLLAAGGRPGGNPILEAQRVVGESAMITAELPGAGGGRVVLAVPPRRWDPSQSFLDQLLSLAGAPWTTPVGLRELAATDPPEVDRARLRYPRSQRRAELPEEYLRALDTQREKIVNLAAILTDTTRIVPGLAASTFRLESSWWGTHESARGNRFDLEQSRLTDLRARVSVQPGTFTFGSKSGRIPVTVVNELRQPVRVQLRLAPQTPRLRLAATQLRTIGPRQKVQVEVQASAVAGGPVAVQATLHTPGGALYGQPVTLRVNVTQIGTVALVITVGAAVVLVVAAGLRVAGRVRAARRARPAGPLTDPDDERADATA